MKSKSIMKSHKFFSLLLGISFAMFWVGSLAADYIKAKEGDRPLAIVRRFKPDVQIKHAGQEAWKQAKMAEQLFDKDTLTTAEAGFALVQFMDNSLAKVKPNSLLIIQGEVISKDNTASRLAVEIGEVFLNVTKRPQNNFEVQTPTSVASVKGTSFLTEVGETGESSFLGFSGSIEVTALESGQKVTVTRNKKAKIDNKGSNIEMESVSDDDLNNEENDLNNLENDAMPKKLLLRFMNDAGQTREVEIEYFENDEN